MQVAVAGVEDVADAQPVLRLELGDPAQHLGQPRPRHDPVLDVVVVGDPAHRRERRLAPLPEQRALVVVAAARISQAPVLAADRLDRGEVLLDLRRGAVELDEQQARSRRG